MSKIELKLAVIEAAQLIGYFDPSIYSKNQEALTKAAKELCNKGIMRWEVKDNGKIIFTLE